MDKVEKFKELLEGYRVASVNFYVELKTKDLNAIEIFQEQLIKMFEEEVYKNENIEDYEFVEVENEQEN